MNIIKLNDESEKITNSWNEINCYDEKLDALGVEKRETQYPLPTQSIRIISEKLMSNWNASAVPHLLREK